MLNSLLMSPTTVGRDGNTSEGLDPDTVVTTAARSTAVPGTERSVRIPMADGVELAATLVPAGARRQPQPCLLEALPYRKDDLTSSYAEGYRSLRDEHGYAVCRVDLRGTGSSGGDATDEYPLVERTDLCTVIAWLADQEWCDGNVGMFGTSYSGFNSLQIAAERPPALKAIVAIYSSDDRWTDDVHWRGHALRLVDLVDYCHYMTPMCVLPPVPAEWPGDRGRLEGEWRRRWETNEPWLLTWLRENRDGPYWRRRVAAARGGYDRIQCPTMIVAGWADGYRNNTFRTVEGLGAAGYAVAAAGRAVGARRPGHRDPRAADRPRPRDGRVVGPVAARHRGARAEGRTGPTSSSGRRPSPSRTWRTHEGYWVSGPWPVAAPAVATLRARGAAVARRRARVGTAAWIDCAGHLPWGLSGDQRDDDARSLTWDCGRRRPWSWASRGSGCGCALGPGRVAVGEAVRRLPRRHLGADHPRHAGPGVPGRVGAGATGAGGGVRRRPAAGRLRLPARPRPPPAGLGGRLGLAQHHRPARRR